MLYILHAGDTEPNPGPEFPCNICNHECDWSRYAVQCDSCNLWYHADCMNMCSEVYAMLEDSNVTWICCTCGLPNFASSLSSSRSTILTNSFSTLSSISSEDDKRSPIATSSLSHATSASKLSASGNNEKHKSGLRSHQIQVLINPIETTK